MLQRIYSDHQQPDVLPDTTETDEIRLLGQVAQAEIRAFEALYRCYYPRLMRFLSRLIRRPLLAEEVLDDTMLVVWHRAASYNHQSKVSTWIFAIAYRKALKAMKNLDEPVEMLAEDNPADSCHEPEQEVGRRQVHKLLQQAMLELSLEQRVVVDLTYFHGMGYAEIASIVACPVATVKTRMFHARRRLRGLLPDRLEEWL